MSPKLFIFLLINLLLLLTGKILTQQSTIVYNITTVAGGSNSDPVSPINNPFLQDNIIFFADTSGQFRRLDLSTGNLTNVAPYTNPNSIQYYGGDMYVLYSNNFLDKIDANGVTTRIAGGSTTFGGNADDGPALCSVIVNTEGIAVSPSGEVYFSQISTNRIRKVSNNGTITTIAGDGTAGDSGDGGLAINSKLKSPSAVVMSNTSDIYFADSGNHRIRVIYSNGTISTIAGNGEMGYSGDGGLATNAQLKNPGGVAIGINGEIYIADSGNHVIRKVSTNGIISTIVGTGTRGAGMDGVYSYLAELDFPFAIAVNSTGEIFIADMTNRVRKVSTRNVINTYAGTLTNGNTGDGGLATSSWIVPSDIAIHPITGELYIAEKNNYKVRKVSSTGIISTVFGLGTSGYSGDGGLAINSQGAPNRICFTSIGETFYTDINNFRVRKISTNGIISTIAGTLVGDGCMANSTYISSKSFKITKNGEIIVADYFRVFKILNNGTMKIIAGNGYVAYNGDGGLATKANLHPTDVAVNPKGEVFITDHANTRIRKVDINGKISTIAGTGTAGYSGDGGLATNAQLFYPNGIALSSRGEVFYVDTSYNVIRKISTNGIISTIAGRGSSGYSGDGGLATNAQLYFPRGIAINETSGEIYISDTNRIRKLTPWCSGNNRRFVDGECICNEGFFGSYCEDFTCNGILKNNSNVCSSNGTCISPEKCSCLEGYYGENCQYFNCSSIPFSDTRVCSSNGQCIEPNVCLCNVTHWDGENCEIPKCFGLVGNEVCSGHGSCKGADECSCNIGYTGQECQYPICFNMSSVDSRVCNFKNGSCQSPDTCECSYGWSGSNCEIPICFSKLAIDSTVCNQRGVCTLPDTCRCDSRYHGKECERTTCFDIPDNETNACYGKGLCIDFNKCDCFNGYGPENDCRYPKCYGILSDDLKVCNHANGTCASVNNCSCNQGYFGEECEITQCNGILSNDSKVCSGRGKCETVEKCECDRGYFGNDCQLTTCEGISSNDSSVCSGNGKCSTFNNCQCEKDWFGNYCNISMCFNVYSNDSNVCSGRGKCISKDVCECETSLGYGGHQCNNPFCFDVLSESSQVCSGNGICKLVDRCECKVRFIASRCQYKEIRGVYLLFNTTNGVANENLPIQVTLSINDSSVAQYYQSTELTATFTFELNGEKMNFDKELPIGLNRFEFSLPFNYTQPGKVSTSVSLTFTENNTTIIAGQSIGPVLEILTRLNPNPPHQSESVNSTSSQRSESPNITAIVVGVIVPVVVIGTIGVVSLIVITIVMLKKGALVGTQKEINMASNFNVELAEGF